MAQPFLGSIEAFGFDFAPKGWALCAGQLLSIQQNAALFSLLGTFYGGDGIRTFALPDLRSRISIGFNSNFAIGAQFGEENHTLVTTEMPIHTHTVNAQNNNLSGGVPNPTATERVASGHQGPGVGVNIFVNNVNPNTALLATGPNGGNQSHPNIMPYCAINYCIALSGIFPSRN